MLGVIILRVNMVLNPGLPCELWRVGILSFLTSHASLGRLFNLTVPPILHV